MNKYKFETHIFFDTNLHIDDVPHRYFWWNLAKVPELERIDIVEGTDTGVHITGHLVLKSDEELLPTVDVEFEDITNRISIALWKALRYGEVCVQYIPLWETTPKFIRGRTAYDKLMSL
jgi:hypothetical protein